MSSLYLQSADYSASSSVLCRDQNLFGTYSCETFPLPERATTQFTRINFGNDRPTATAMPPNWRFAKSTDFNGATTAAASSSKPKTAIAVRLLSRLIEGKNGDFTALKKNSVRTQKTVKRVSFSDEMGLALTSVRTFSSSLSCPFPDSEERRSGSSADQSSTTRVPTFVLNFRQPQSCKSTFLERLERNSVQLGSIEIKEGVIVGEVMVKNLAYEKTVFVRYTGSDWSSFTDVHASYVSHPEPKSCYAGCDAFEFQFPIPLEVNRDGCVEFAVCYEVGGRTFWDNNNSAADGRPKNYRVTKMFFDGCSRASRSFQNHEVYATGRSISSTDRTVFDIVQRTAADWSEFTGRKNGINCTPPYW